MSEPTGGLHLDSFLDAVAARTPTPGGGAVAAAVGAMACAMARMVAAYSVGKNADRDITDRMTELAWQLERVDQLLRGLLVEDARAYRALAAAAKRLKADPSTESQHAAALGVALTVPMEIGAAACEALSVMEHLLPAARRYLVSDLGVAAVLAEATVRAASYMVYVNATALRDSDARHKAKQEIDQLVTRAGDTLTRIRAALCDAI